jgi:anaerobic magnesium-protoporphyrin IX monomethyl ester cyclase
VAHARRLRVALVYVGWPESASHPVMSPPIGTQLLGSILLGHGHEVTLFDSRLQPIEEIMTGIDDLGPHVVGFSFLSPSAHQAIDLARRVRAGGRFTVAGGVHASIHAAQLMRSGAFDCVVRQEGENAMVDICDQVCKGRPPQGVVIGTQWAALDALPAYADFPLYRPVYDPAKEFRSVYVQLGRGCPMKCTFCELPNTDVFPPARRRFRTIDSVMAELHVYLRRWRINFITVVDSIATLNLPLIIDFVRRVDAELPGVGFMFNAHANRFSRELAETVGTAQRGRRHASEMITVWFGFESGSQRLLDFMAKGTTVEQGRAVADLCHANGVQIGANLLLGVPTETPADYQLHHEFMDYVKPHFPNPNILNPLPGTQMYEYCQRTGILRDEHDYTIWTGEDIAARGEGPITTVDYGLVLDSYRRYRVEEPAPETNPARYRPWAEPVTDA